MQSAACQIAGVMLAALAAGCSHNAPPADANDSGTDAGSDAGFGGRYDAGDCAIAVTGAVTTEFTVCTDSLLIKADGGDSYELLLDSNSSATLIDGGLAAVQLRVLASGNGAYLPTTWSAGGAQLLDVEVIESDSASFILYWQSVFDPTRHDQNQGSPSITLMDGGTFQGTTLQGVPGSIHATTGAAQFDSDAGSLTISGPFF